MNVEQTLTIYDSETSTVKTYEKLIISSINENSLLSDSGIFENDILVSLTYNGIVYDTTENYLLRSYTLEELLLSSNAGDILIFKIQREEIDGEINEYEFEIILTELYTKIID